MAKFWRKKSVLRVEEMNTNKRHEMAEHEKINESSKNNDQ